jgi:hypothetical protein
MANVRIVMRTYLDATAFAVFEQHLRRRFPTFDPPGGPRPSVAAPAHAAGGSTR